MYILYIRFAIVYTLRSASSASVSVSSTGRCRRVIDYVDPLQYTELSCAQLDVAVERIILAHPGAGSVVVTGGLRARGIRVHRRRIWESIRRLEPWGVMESWSSLIPRRVYSVAGPNAVWHIDGNYKLISWSLVIHEGMDGYFRLVVFL